jgi:hypothetical protein
MTKGSKKYPRVEVVAEEKQAKTKRPLSLTALIVVNPSSTFLALITLLCYLHSAAAFAFTGRSGYPLTQLSIWPPRGEHCRHDRYNLNDVTPASFDFSSRQSISCAFVYFTMR